MIGFKKSESVKHLFANLKIFTVYSLYIFKSIKYVKEHNNDFILKTNHLYSTRNKVLLDRHKLEFYK